MHKAAECSARYISPVFQQKELAKMTSKFSIVLFLALMLTATSSWAMDAEDQDDAAKDAPAKTQDADAKPTALEQHVASAPPSHAFTHSGQPAAKHPLNVALTPYYKINNKGRDNVWGIKLQMTLVTPELFRH
jgi:hypothetical protein